MSKLISYWKKLGKWETSRFRIGLLIQALVITSILITPLFIFFEQIGNLFNWFGNKYSTEVGRYLFVVLATWLIIGKKVGRSDVTNSVGESDDFSRIISNMMMWIFSPLVIVSFISKAIKDKNNGRGRYNKWWKDFFMLFVSNMTWVKREWVEYEKSKQEIREDRLKKLLKEKKWWQIRKKR